MTLVRTTSRSLLAAAITPSLIGMVLVFLGWRQIYRA